MQTINKCIKTAKVENRNWKDALQSMLLQYRVTPHTTTKETPGKLFYNRELRSSLPTMKQKPSPHYKRVKRNQTKMNNRVKQRNGKLRNFKIGDTVLLQRDRKRNKFSTTYYPEPFTRTRLKGTMITVRNKTGITYTRNVSF